MFYKEQHLIYPYKSTNKPLPLSNLKAFADGNFIVAQMVQFLYDRVENTVEKGENDVTNIFSCLHHVFKKVFLSGASKVVIVR